MIEINKATAFTLNEDNQARSGDKITEAELDALITSASQLMNESVRESFSARMENHVGSRSTYALKDTVLQGLKVIYDKFENPNTTESEKKIIAFKLQERAEECTPGFHNGINAVVDSFYAAKNINDLLSRVRQDIVTRVASQLSDDVHVNNRCFVLAENLGYGVHALNRDDHHLNYLSGVITNDKIGQALSAAFEKEFRVFFMLQGLEGQLRGQLDSTGYVGPKDTPYTSDEQTKIEAALKQLFKDNSIIAELQAAQDTLNEQDYLKKALGNDVEVALENMGLSKRNIQVFLNPSNKLPILQKQLQEKLDSISAADQEALEKIKSNYMREIAAFDTSARDRLTAANQAFESKLFVVKKDDDGMNEGITDINWPNIKEMLWQGIKEHRYFEFTNHEDARIDMLMDPHVLPKDWSLHEIFKTTQELIQAINYLNPPAQAAEQSLSHQLEQLTEDSRYEAFKNIVKSMDNRVIKDEVIKKQGAKFLPELKQDIPTLLAIIPFMTSDTLSECLSDTTLRHHLVHHAALEQPRSLSFLVESIENLSRNYKDEIFNQILPKLITSPDDVIRLLRHLSPEQCATACNAMKEHLSNMTNWNTFGQVLQHLSPEKCGIFCDAMKESLPSFFMAPIRIIKTFKNLSQMQCSAVFNAMKPQLLNIVKTGSQVGHLMEFLSLEDLTYVFDIIKPELTHLITSGHDFNSVLEYLLKDQRTIVFDMMQNQLPQIITSSYDLYAALEYLSEDQITIVFNMIEPQIPNMIKDADTFGRTMGHLLPSQYDNIFNQVKAELPTIIGSPHNIPDALTWLTLERCSDVIHTIKSEFQNFIKSNEDFNKLIKYLGYLENEEKLKLVIDNCEGILHQAVLDNKFDFCEDLIDQGVKPAPETFLQICSTDNASIVHVIHALLHNNIIGPQDIISTSSKQNNMGLIQRLFDEGIISPNRGMLTQACNDGDIEVIQILIHNSIIKNTFDFKNVLESLEPEQRTAVYEAIEKDLPNIIRNGRSLGRALNYLTPEQCISVVKTMHDNLPGIIKDSYDFNRAFKPLNLEQRAAVFESIKSHVYTIIQTPDDLGMIREYLTPEQHADLSNNLLSQEQTKYSAKKQASMRESLAETREGLSSEPEQKQDKEDKHGAESSHDPTP
ncbi:MAG: hypothetical protein P1U36_08950 [Legionellaceae bacterium]|nr:hypothetical protein [Legionellaceae bacterium]